MLENAGRGGTDKAVSHSSGQMKAVKLAGGSSEGDGPVTLTCAVSGRGNAVSVGGGGMDGLEGICGSRSEALERSSCMGREVY